jgi:hypothetical protein
MRQPKPPKAPNIERLALAASLLQNNPAFKEAMSAVRGTYTQAMINSDPNDAARREHFHRCIHSLTDIESALTAFIQSGTLEKLTATKQQKAKK